jgi:hypothetical protein
MHGEDPQVIDWSDVARSVQLRHAPLAALCAWRHNRIARRWRYKDKGLSVISPPIGVNGGQRRASLSWSSLAARLYPAGSAAPGLVWNRR